MLKITKVIIVGHKILAVNGYKKITITPDSPYQLFLGANGSGKSVLQKEIIRVVSSGKAYYKGGSKTIEYLLNDTVIHCISNYDKQAGEHQFLVDGVELNEGHTAKVQKSLVEKYLGYTEDLYELITGRVKFTEMLPTQRRQWFTRISNSKMDYAFKCYNHYRSKERGLKATLKFSTNRLAELRHELVSSGSRDSLSQEMESLVTTINKHMRCLSSANTDVSQSESLVTHLSDRVTSLTKTLARQLPSVQRTTKGMDDHAYLEYQMQGIPQRLDALRNQQSELTTTLMSVQEELQQAMGNTGGYTEDQVLSNLEALKQTLQANMKSAETLIASEPTLTLNRSHDALASSILNTGKPLFHAIRSVSAILQDMSENYGQKYSSARLEKERMELDYHYGQKRKLESSIDHTSELIRQHESSPTIVCPSCDSHFKQGDATTHVEGLYAERKAFQDSYNATLQSIETLEEAIEKNAEFVNSVNACLEVCRNTGVDIVKQELLDRKFYLDNPRDHIHFLSLLQSYAEKLMARQELETDMKGWESLLRTIQASSGQHISSLIKRKNELESEITNVQSDIEEKNKELVSLRQVADSYKSCIGIHEQLTTALEELRLSRAGLLDAIRDDVINEAIATLQVELAGVRKRLNDAQRITVLIEEIEAQIEQLTLDIKVTGATADALSPFDGFIAEQLRYYIETIIGRLNETISEVWYSNMQVLPCDSDEGDLDYKFPLQREGAEDPAPDISDASFGQKEIINFSFVKVYLELTGLRQYPMFVDELGVNFDEHHRNRIMNYLKNMLVRNEASQLWMISHYATLYGTFQSPDVFVVNPDNITVPERYNTHVTLA